MPRARKNVPKVTYRSSDLRWAAPPYAYACGCVLAYADKRLTIFNTYAQGGIGIKYSKAVCRCSEGEMRCGGYYYYYYYYYEREREGCVL